MWVRQVIDFLDDIQQGIGAFRFVFNRFGRFVGWRDERFVVGRTDQKQVGVKLFFGADVQLVNERAQFAQSFFFDAVKRAVAAFGGM